MKKPFIKTICLGAALLCSAAMAQTASPAVRPPAYGPDINADHSRRIAAAAVAEAKKYGWAMAISVVDTAGQLVYFEKMDDTQNGSIQVSLDKARSAALFRRPTKVFNDMLAGGNSYVLAITGAVPVEGGLPLSVDGKVVGAIGVSGGTGAQDGITARAGSELLK